MLPFLEPKKIVSLISARKGKPDVEAAQEVQAPESEMNPDLLEAARDLLSAVERKSVSDIAQAMRAAFDILESSESE